MTQIKSPKTSTLTFAYTLNVNYQLAFIQILHVLYHIRHKYLLICVLSTRRICIPHSTTHYYVKLRYNLINIPPISICVITFISRLI